MMDYDKEIKNFEQRIRTGNILIILNCLYIIIFRSFTLLMLTDSKLNIIQVSIFIILLFATYLIYLTNKSNYEWISYLTNCKRVNNFLKGDKISLKNVDKTINNINK